MFLQKLIITVFIATVAHPVSFGQSPLSPVDTNLYHIDTVITSVRINQTLFTLEVLRDKSDEHLIPFNQPDYSFEQSPITLLLIGKADHKVYYKKKFDFEPDEYPYFNYSIYKGQGQKLEESGRLYITLNKSYGGSGSTSFNYCFAFTNNKITLTSMFESSGELTYLLFKKDDTEILALNGVWNAKEEEAHFSNHRYTIAQYSFKNEIISKKELGKTKFKYACLDDDKSSVQILSDIKKREPQLLRSIQVRDYK